MLSLCWSEPSQKNLLEDIGKMYRDAGSVQMSIVKSDKNELLGSEKQSSGVIQQKSGNVHIVLEAESSETTTIIVNKDQFWMIKPPPPQFKEAKTQVISAKRSGPGWSQQILLRLLSNNSFSEDFELVEQKERGGSIALTLKTKDKKSTTSDIELVVDKTSLWIQKLGYKMDNGNRTDITVSSTKFNVPVDKNLFKYKPPKNAQVTTY